MRPQGTVFYQFYRGVAAIAAPFVWYRVSRKLAREGVEIERKARPVTIFSLELTSFREGEFPEADVEIHCSKGTYVLSLIHI